MNERPILERAFELARSGAFTEVKALDRALAAEGYARNDPHTHSPTARRQLKRLCREARARAAGQSQEPVTSVPSVPVLD
jgi:hypothetical protein